MEARFSEMILKGIPMIPARRHHEANCIPEFIYLDSALKACAACAIGTGLVAANVDMMEAEKRWPILNRLVFYRGYASRLWEVASMMFEYDGYSREEVAAFLAEKEREEEEKKAAVEAGAGVGGEHA